MQALLVKADCHSQTVILRDSSHFRNQIINTTIHGVSRHVIYESEKIYSSADPNAKTTNIIQTYAFRDGVR